LYRSLSKTFSSCLDGSKRGRLDLWELPLKVGSNPLESNGNERLCSFSLQKIGDGSENLKGPRAGENQTNIIQKVTESFRFNNNLQRNERLKVVSIKKKKIVKIK